MEFLIFLILGIILGFFINFFRQSIKKDLQDRPASKTSSKKAEVEETDDKEEDWEDGSEEGSSSEEGDEKDELVKERKRKAMDEALIEKYGGTEGDMGEVKMVLVVREDLKMGKGKIGAQCGHATLGAYRMVKREVEKSSKFWTKVLEAYSWKMGLHKKICLKVNSEQEL